MAIEKWSGAHFAYPAVFYFFAGPGIAWLIYAVVILVIECRRSDARMALADLRAEGTNLRIECGRLSTSLELSSWIGKSGNWTARVVAAIRQIDAPDARVFETVDFPGKPRAELTGYISDQHRLEYTLHDSMA
jgi:hypothetical protein